MCTSKQQYKTNNLVATYVYESTQQYKTNNLLLHTASMNEPTDMYVRCLLYLKTLNAYQVTLVLSRNDNDSYWHHYQLSSLTPLGVRFTIFYSTLHVKIPNRMHEATIIVLLRLVRNYLHVVQRESPHIQDRNKRTVTQFCSTTVFLLYVWDEFAPTPVTLAVWDGCVNSNLPAN